ncbi:MAG: PEGA domain-containing protein [Rhodospirillales bacterium]|jgi:formylglycine-generating enzyme required for sulfatase activity
MMRIEVTEDTRIQTYSVEDLPLALELSASGAPTIVAVPLGRPLAWIRGHGAGLAIQPELAARDLMRNGLALSAATWIENGDVFETGGWRIEFRTKEGTAHFEIRSRVALEAPGILDSDAQAQLDRIGRPIAGTQRANRRFRAARWIAAGFLMILTLAGVGVLTVEPTDIRITPEPDTISIRGTLPMMRLGERYLAFPGRYEVSAVKAGYKDLRASIDVTRGSLTVHALELEKTGGVLRVRVVPAVPATITVDGHARGQTPADIEAAAGSRMLEVTANRYLPERRTIEVQGAAIVQEIEITLQPAWANVAMASRPAGAAVLVDGESIGQTPLTAELLEGRRELVVQMQGWKPTRSMLDVKAGETRTLAPFELERSDGTLAITSEPSGASVVVNGQFRGTSPLSVPLTGDRDYRLSLSMSGYEADTRAVRVEPERTARVAIQMKPEYGTVFVTTTPPGAALRVAGREVGSGSQRLSLQTIPQTIEASAPGYEPAQVSVTPQKDAPRRIEIALRTIGQAQRDRFPPGTKNSAGQALVFVQLLKPVAFTLGSPRRDPLRRSNELETAVELTRSFLIGAREVTNAEFKRFRSQHSSGSVQGISLDAPEQPVVNVSWDDAARYANWLSAAEGLRPAYREEGGRLIPILPFANGYRLPTEAEWEFVSRLEAGTRESVAALRYPWGNDNAPAQSSGNFAHEGSGLPATLTGYVDPHIASAPVGQFPPNRAQIFDLAGNVAEWCHDIYGVEQTTGTATTRDPIGPTQGRFRVIKGSSWRSGNAAELRFAYRDYSDKPRDDLGFRLVRYVD